MILSFSRLAPLAGLFWLAGCFASETSLIPTDDAVLPVEGPMTVCLDSDDPCLDLVRDGDGYYAPSPDDTGETVSVRFAPLIQAGGRQVFIAEAQLKPEDGPSYIYGLARRLSQPDARGATMQIAALDCDELSEETLAGFEAGGGVVEPGKVMGCRPVSLDQLKAVLLAAHRDGLAMDEWWKAHAEDL